MPHCAAFGCNFQSKGNKSSDVSLHSFPSDKKRRKEWEDACGRIQLPKDPRLCSRHFSPDAFEAFSRPQLMKELTEIRTEKRQRQETLDAILVGCKHDTIATEGESSSVFAEELDNSSVSLRSVSVQCYSVMVDATTQKRAKNNTTQTINPFCENLSKRYRDKCTLLKIRHRRFVVITIKCHKTSRITVRALYKANKHKT
uniref:THAP domain-containing protein 1 n=1 Tax=Sinocyclocheilus grahami TaxID=75366 RepID=A0A672LEA0_SINGR